MENIINNLSKFVKQFIWKPDSGEKNCRALGIPLLQQYIQEFVSNEYDNQMPYGTGTGDSDNCENAIALHRTGSDQPVNYVLGAVCPGVPCEEDGPPGPGSVS